MTLRLRMVLAIGVLVTIGLSVFGVVTYSLYSRSQYERLDTQLKSSVSLASGFLRSAAGLDDFPGFTGFPGSNGTSNNGTRPDGRPTNLPVSSYAELRDSSGQLLEAITLSTSTGTPKLATSLTASNRDEARFFTAPSATGSGDWRVYVAAVDRPQGDTVVVAIPLTEVDESLNRLILIETLAAATLLALLTSGSWFILRRGLRPLEIMADSARTITAGSLDERVSPADGRTEVGQLGLALNTMLQEIEDAFSERDATELRLRQFLADASHELRTPLTSIQGFAELFRLGAEGDRAQLEVIFRRIEDESARMKTLVEDLLLLARLDETRSAERGPVDLSVLAADACSDMIAIDRTRRVTLDAPEPVVVAGDQGHLRQALGNLVTNAVKHTPEGSPIEVTARLLDGGAMVSVRDHGLGLDPAALEHVFDRFWQADRARVGAGAGLGLAIVAGIAEEHGGTATVENAPLIDGRPDGAVFTLRLPLTNHPR